MPVVALAGLFSRFTHLYLFLSFSKTNPEHAVEMWRLLPHAKLFITPGLHGAYIGEITTGMEHSKIPELTVAVIEEFLNEPIA